MTRNHWQELNSHVILQQASTCRSSFECNCDIFATLCVRRVFTGGQQPQIEVLMVPREVYHHHSFWHIVSNRALQTHLLQQAVASLDYGDTNILYKSLLLNCLPRFLFYFFTQWNIYMFPSPFLFPFFFTCSFTLVHYTHTWHQRNTEQRMVI